MTRRLAKFLVLLCGTSALSLLGCGSLGNADSGPGDTTSKAAVLDALEGTGYRIAYRRTPRVEGYEMVVGSAGDERGDVVDFSVVVSSSGVISHNPESRRGGSPQFPIIRYSEVAGSAIGNINIVTQPQSEYVLRRMKGLGWTWTARRAETRMAIRIESALYRLFAPGVRGGP